MYQSLRKGGGIAATLLIASSAGAQTFVWTGATNNTWDTTTPNWAGAGSTWVNSSTSDAVFTGPAGTITLTGNITANEVSFETSEFRLTGGSLTFAGSGSFLRLFPGQSAFIDTPIGGSVGLNIVGSGSMVIRQPCTYTGATTIDLTALNLFADNALPAGTAVHISSALLILDGVTQEVGALTGGGRVTTTSSDPSLLILRGSEAGAVYTGVLQDLPQTLTVRKVGTGSQTLAGIGQHSGNTEILAGALIAADNSAFSDSYVTVESGATWGLSGSITQANSGTITGSGAVARAGALANVSGLNTVTGLITIGPGSNQTIGATSGTLTLTQSPLCTGHALRLNALAGTIITLPSVNGATGITKLGDGTLVLTGPSEFTGGVTHTRGTLLFGHSNALANNVVTFEPGTGKVLRMNGLSATVRGLAGDDPGAFVDNASSATPAVLTVNNTGTSTFSGIIWDGPSSARLGLTKSGTGTLVLSGINSYTGPTTVTGGTLTINGSLASPVTVNGGTLAGSGPFSGPVTVNGGSLAPASTGQGTMTFANGLTLTGGTVQIQGPIPIVGFDQIMVTGGDVDLGEGVAALNLTTSGSPSYGSGARVPLLINTGAGATTGHFANSPSGDEIASLAGYGDQPHWYIHYAANTATGAMTGGNDIVLSPQPGFVLGNGSFETGIGNPTTLEINSTNIDYWTVTRDNIDWTGDDTWEAAEGSRSVDLQGLFATGGVRQIVSLQARTWYRLTFALAGNPDGGPDIKHMSVRIASLETPFTFDATNSTREDMGWVDRSILFFNTDAGPVKFEFFSTDPPFHYGAVIDDVRLAVDSCEADLSSTSDPNDPFYGVSDGLIDSADFFFFLDKFTAGDQVIADLSGSADPNDPAYGVPDNVIDAADFFYYLDIFVAGCS